MPKLGDLVSSILARWRGGERADALAVLEANPEIRRDKSIVLDLAYEEYCQRKSAGEDIDVDKFCADFSVCRYSLCRLIEVHDFVDENPSVLEVDSKTDWPEPGDQFNEYRLLEELGRGAIGRVFLAKEDGMLSRQVVLKVSPSGRAEAQTLVKLQHPHVVPVYDVKTDAQRTMFGVVMPFLGRTTLSDFLDAAFVDGSAPPRLVDVLRRLHLEYPVDELVEVEVDLAKLAGISYVNGVVGLARDLAEALAHTHQRQILHLDLKPSNVLLPPAGRPMLLDFNLSADVGERSGLLGGTLPYMSPEQIRAAVFKSAADAAAVDGRSDVFSLGVILYELLSGRHPFALQDWKRGAREVGEKLLEKQAGGAPLLSTFCEQVDSRLARIVARTLELDQSRRIQSAEELAAELEKCLSTAQRLRRAVHVRRREFIAAGALVGACLTGCMSYIAMLPKAEERLLAAGWRHYQAEDYEQAAQAFQKAADIDGQLAEAWFGLGRSRLWSGNDTDLVEAIVAFKNAHKIEPDPRYLACTAYALTVKPELSVSLGYYKEALDHGFESPEFYNSYAFSLINKFGATQGELQSAEQFLKLAIDEKPNLLPARYNLVLLQIKRDGQFNPTEEADIQYALKNADATVELANSEGIHLNVLYYSCAMIWLDVGGNRPEQNDKMLTYLEDAVRYGYPRERILSTGRLSQLNANPRFEALAQVQQRPESPPISLFTDPLGDEWRRRRPAVK